jgi:amino acid adenylation domain-containing protein
VLKAGGAYVPMDIGYPQERIDYMLEDTQAVLVLSQRALSSAAGIRVPGDKVIYIDLSEDLYREEDVSNLALHSSANDLAYMIYTSGTTGKPKGAMIEHKGLLNHLLSMVDELNLNEQSRIAQTAPSTFDISVWQFLNGLIIGGCAVIYSDNLIKEPLQFLKKLQAASVNILQLVPSHILQLLDFDDNAFLKAINYLLITGEAVSHSILNKWFSHYPDITVINAYGPTEAADDVSLFHINQIPTTQNIPIGKPIRNTRLYILDEIGNVCPIGVIGELNVCGHGVGRGYWNDILKTKHCFVKDPFSSEHGSRMYKTGDLCIWLKHGNIEYIGR